MNEHVGGRDPRERIVSRNAPQEAHVPCAGQQPQSFGIRTISRHGQMHPSVEQPRRPDRELHPLVLHQPACHGGQNRGLALPTQLPGAGGHIGHAHRGGAHRAAGDHAGAEGRRQAVHERIAQRVGDEAELHLAVQERGHEALSHGCGHAEQHANIGAMGDRVQLGRAAAAERDGPRARHEPVGHDAIGAQGVESRHGEGSEPRGARCAPGVVTHAACCAGPTERRAMRQRPDAERVVGADHQGAVGLWGDDVDFVSEACELEGFGADEVAAGVIGRRGVGGRDDGDAHWGAGWRGTGRGARGCGDGAGEGGSRGPLNPSREREFGEAYSSQSAERSVPRNVLSWLEASPASSLNPSLTAVRHTGKGGAASVRFARSRTPQPSEGLDMRKILGALLFGAFLATSTGGCTSYVGVAQVGDKAGQSHHPTWVPWGHLTRLCSREAL